MAGPLVSIVIPSYNRAAYIRAAVESAIAQTYPHVEVIVINDGSTDDTEEQLAACLPHIRYVRQENAERGASRNHGLRLARGEFIVFLDSDDVLLPDKVERDLAFLRDHPSAGVVYTDALLISAEGEPLRTAKRPARNGRVTGALLRGDNFISIGCHLIRTELVRRIGGFREERELSGVEDWEMWVRLSTVADFAYHPVATTMIRTHDANTMGNPVKMERALIYAVDLLAGADYLAPQQRKVLPRTRSKVALLNAINYCSARRTREAGAWLARALHHHPAIVADPRFAYTMARMIRNAGTVLLRSARVAGV